MGLARRRNGGISMGRVKKPSKLTNNEFDVLKD